MRVRVDVDQSRHDHAVGTIDDPIGGASETGADMGDAIAIKGDVDATAIDMPAGSLIPGDDPIGILDDGRCHLTPPDKLERPCYSRATNGPAAIAGDVK